MDTVNPHLERGVLLFRQNRLDLAEPELRQAIAHDPNLARAYSYLALCLGNAQKWKEATDAAQQGVGLEPGDAYAHFALADVYADRRMYKESRESIDEAIRLSPGEPLYWSALARVDISEHKHQDALEAAERGLELDPEHEACINLRAIALTQLGRKSDAAAAIDTTLARNPLNAASHANMGWTLLHQGKPKEAKQHFLEALRLDPSSDWARKGMLEAMKARNPVYRIFLAYFLFMGRLSPRARWAVIVGGYFGYQLLRQAAKTNPTVDAIATPLIIAYIVFAIGTMVSRPLFNLFLLGSRMGRHTLDRSERWAALAFGVSLIPAAVMLTLWARTHTDIGNAVYELCSLIWGIFPVPVCAAGQARAGKARIVMIGWVLVLAGLAVMFTVSLMGEPPTPIDSNWLTGYVIGTFGSTWVLNIISTRALPRRD